MTPAQVDIALRFGTVLLIAGTTLLYLERTRGVLTRFLAETAHPLDLAIARIAIMALVVRETRLGAILPFSHLDAALLAPPRGWSHLAPLVPLAPDAVRVAYVALLIAAACAIVGWSGRFMCGVVGICALYLHTVPQLFGKVNHTANHLVLFCAVLAAAPCCDALAIDALRRAARQARAGVIDHQRPGRAYAWPLQTMMLLIGLAYFFPGAWKVARAPSAWFSSANLALLIRAKLLESGLTPLQHWVVDTRGLLWTMVLGTVVFELAFVFAVLIPRARWVAAATGVVFHSFTGIVMDIWFTGLQLSYVVFVPWSRCLHWIADQRQVTPVTLLYDARSSRACRLVSAATACDWLDLVHPEPIGRASPASETVDGARATPRGPWMTTWAVRDVNGRLSVGHRAVARALAARLPLAWPLQRLIVRPPVYRLAARLCDALTRSRAAGHTARHGAPTVPPALSPALRATTSALLIAVVLAGASHVVRTWPIACYPPFDIPAQPSVDELVLLTQDVDGRDRESVLSFDSAMASRFGSDRWRGLVSTFIDGRPPLTDARARAVLAAWRSVHPGPPLRSAALVVDAFPLDAPTNAPVVQRRRAIGHWSLPIR